jgi:MYXO-CTERM domain-containing protein
VLIPDRKLIVQLEALPMKSTRPILSALAAAASALVLCAGAQAAPTVSVVPSATSVVYGGALTADIVVSGLDGTTGPVGGFGFDFDFDGLRLSFGSFTVDPDGKMGAGSFDLSGGLSGFSVNFLMLADTAIDEPTLFAQQAPGFVLGRVNFTALSSNANAALTLRNVTLSAYGGITSIAGVTTSNASVCVEPTAGAGCGSTPPPPTMPIPSTALLVATALGGLALRRRSVA